VEVAIVPVSLNVTFAGAAPKDAEFEHPEGASVARLLRDAAQQMGWAVRDLDNWRDVGWSVLCSKGVARLEVVISSAGQDQWMLQVAPETVPGLVGRALGKQPTASHTEVLDLANVVHHALSEGELYRGFRWAWDGPPNANSEQEPERQM
jgi:hypothetical protein